MLLLLRATSPEFLECCSQFLVQVRMLVDIAHAAQ